MGNDVAQQAADIFMDIRRTKNWIETLPEEVRPTNLEEAYAIQDKHVAALIAETSSTVVGYKGGATNPTAMATMGLEEPFRAVLLSAFMQQSPATLPAGSCNVRVLESEVAFRMGDNLPAAAFPYDKDAVMGAIASVMPAIEVVDTRFKVFGASGGLQAIADNGAAGYWVPGTEISDWRQFDYDDFPISLHINGDKVADGNSANVLESPINSLTWIANQLCLAGGGLKEGDLVTTGTATPPTPCNEGDQVMADFGSMGQVEIQF